MLTYKEIINNNSKKITLLVLLEYTEQAKDYYDIYNTFKEEYDIIIIDWEPLYSLGNNFKFSNFKEYVIKVIKEKQIDPKNTIIIGSGIGATMIPLLQKEYEFKKNVYISPIFSETFVSPFLSNIPTYKNKFETFCLRMQKEYFDYFVYFSQKHPKLLEQKYDFYKQHLDFFDTALAQISIYETLKEIRKFERKISDNSIIFIGTFDQVASSAILLRQFKKHYFKTKVPIILFDNSSHHLEQEETKLFISNLKEFITKN